MFCVDVTSCSSNPSPCRGFMEECIDGEEEGTFDCRCRAGYTRNNDDDCEGITDV